MYNYTSKLPMSVYSKGGGATGPQGLIGPQGPQGPQGAIGPTAVYQNEAFMCRKNAPVLGIPNGVTTALELLTGDTYNVGSGVLDTTLGSYTAGVDGFYNIYMSASFAAGINFIFAFGKSILRINPAVGPTVTYDFTFDNANGFATIAPSDTTINQKYTVELLAGDTCRWYYELTVGGVGIQYDLLIDAQFSGEKIN